MNPKYSVGERVILQSKSHPEYNGEYTIIKILKDLEVSTCRITQTAHACKGGTGDIAYLLDEPHLSKSSGQEIFWAEVALRKKHEPSQMSFQSLIQSINSPVKQES